MSLMSEVAARVERLELPFNRFGVDPYGVSKKHLKRAMGAGAWLYRNYFRVRVHGISNLPPRGRVMLVGNHAGGVAIDGAMVTISLLLEMDPPRLAQGMAEKFLSRVPFLSKWTQRCGQLAGLPSHATRLLEDDRVLMVFPEGAKGTAKLYKDRHSLVKFGSGFMRLAMATKSPILPFGFVGGGEAIPTIYNSYALGKLVGAPYVPVTPYGVALPLPVRLDIVYGEPMVFEGNGNEDDSLIFGNVDKVKQRISNLIADGLSIRDGEVPTRYLGSRA